MIDVLAFIGAFTLLFLTYRGVETGVVYHFADPRKTSPLPARFTWTLGRGARWQILHPSAGRFCHICGADGFKNEPCDAGLHS